MRGRAVLAALLLSCAARTEAEESAEPPRAELDYEVYAAGVHDVFARRCGSLDCHGSTARAMRVYWYAGLRQDGLLVGRQPTSEAEVRATFESIAALTSLAPRLVFDKAQGRAGHEGGVLVFGGADPAEKCLAEWLGVARDRSGPRPTTEPSFADACRAAAAMP